MRIFRDPAASQHLMNIEISFVADDLRRFVERLRTFAYGCVSNVDLRTPFHVRMRRYDGLFSFATVFGQVRTNQRDYQSHRSQRKAPLFGSASDIQPEKTSGK
jgi:hypothetical protein